MEKRLPLLFIISWASVLLCIGGIRAQEPVNSSATGEMIYGLHCLRCHGENGDGKGPDSFNLVVSPKDFHSPESTAKSELELRAIIIWGVVFSPMHGWWDRLSTAEIRDVISYIRQLAPYQPRI